MAPPLLAGDKHSHGLDAGTGLAARDVAVSYASASDAAQPAWQNLPAAAQELLSTIPGTHALLVDGRVRSIYGNTMGAAATAEQAASNWLAQHAEAFGVGQVDLREKFSAIIGNGRFTVFAYEQFIDNAPVEHGLARVLVNNDLGNEVVYAAATLAQASATAPRGAISADAAVAIATSRRPDLPIWSGASAAWYFGDGRWTTAARVWKIVGEQPDLTRREKYTFFVDAASGAVLQTRDEVLHANVIGTVNAKATPGTLPDTVGNPPVLAVVPDLLMSVTGGSTAYSDNFGLFDITHAGTTAVTVTTNASAGRWVNVNNNSTGGEISASVLLTPGVAGTVTLNNTPSQNLTAQANALIHTALIHDYIRDRSSWTGMDFVMTANVNIASTCNAFYDGTINFYLAGGGCNNTAYSSVVAHEYGHGIVNNLGLGQGGFGEGYGDTVGMLLYDDPIVGKDFFTSGADIRNPPVDNIQYPCSAEIHTCGELLAGVWWRVRTGFGTKYGTAGLELTRQLQVDWSLVTAGGTGSNFVNSAHPGTAIEVLTCNDDDGNLNNGTPDYTEICAAFAGHSIDCPPVSPLTFTYPEGLPTILTPDITNTFRVLVTSNGGIPTPGTGTVSYSIDGNPSFTTVAMAILGTNDYRATLPALPCGSRVRFYVSSGSDGGTIDDPFDAPTVYNAADVSSGQLVPFEDDFETNKSWTVGGTGDTATTGVWTRVDPVGTAAQPEDDHTAGGTLCFVTGQGAVGGGLGDNDVDGGKTTLTSPNIDLSTAVAPRISYWRWYSNDTGAAPNADTFRVEISNNGTTWVLAETVGPAGDQTSGGWKFHDFAVADFVSPTATVKVRFIAEDAGSGSLVEAAVDDFKVTASDCDTACTGDLDGDQARGLSDLGIVLANFGLPNRTPEQGDFDADTDIDLSDLGVMLSVFGLPCP